jgi:hypothetical protein
MGKKTAKESELNNRVIPPFVDPVKIKIQKDTP